MNRLLAVNIGQDLPLGTGRSVSSTFPTFSVIVDIIIRNSFTIISVVLVGLLLFGGLTFIMGAGSQDQKKAAQGKAIITDAIIGFVVTLFAYLIVQIIEIITGLKILNSGL
jgi:hypothetical protein